MADFENLDALLSDSLKRAAEPANSAGVADAIRSRVAAGDAGTSVAGSTAPGWGGPSAFGIVPWIGLIVAAGVVGGAAGAGGAFGTPAAPVDGSVPAYVIASDTAPAFLCPDGPPAGVLIANTRVLAVARDADGGWLGVRDPANRDSLLWFAADDIVLDDSAADAAALPVLGCPEVTVTQVTPTPDPEPTEDPDPEPDPDPQPPADTTAPTLSKLAANPTVIYNGQATQISVSAADDVGVAGVQLSWSVPGNSGSGSMALSGGQWRFTYSDADLSDGFGNITFTARAVDSAGNLSSPLQVIVNRQYFG